MNAMVLIGTGLLAGSALQAAANMAPVYAVKPWTSPVTTSDPSALPSRSVASRALPTSAVPATDTSVWPDASQSIMRKFVCETRPKELIYNSTSCGNVAAQ